MDDLDEHQKEEWFRSLLAATDRCSMERMKPVCASILCKRHKAENVAATLALSDQHHCSQVKDACIGFINPTNTLDDVVSSPG
ncbi:hypothetical protein PR202_ga27562 [Eleusine coracana subsp. coracana]|uniref:BPM/SPOP BACK domain-containing protein n=1 Tax=Eleusine coracana subsp. coracana TaxID=191504 RepID=A0AAV5DH04_ELECO|nr:hypothetical protein PR202_ga27562 [Eleusine coracana subsp. coracana]